jgi:hypothetical protein
MLKLPGHIRYSYSPTVRRTDYIWPEGKTACVLYRAQHRAFPVRDRDRNGSEQSNRRADDAKLRVA